MEDARLNSTPISGRNLPRRFAVRASGPGKWFLGVGLVVSCLLGAGYKTSTAVAGSPSPSGSPKHLVAQYIADLNAHRYRAAYALEAPCSATFSISNGPGAPPGRGGLPGRAPYSPRMWEQLRHVKVQRFELIKSSVLIRRIERIGRLLTPIRFVGVEVDGWFTFVYPPPSSQFAGNNERPSGYHRAIVIVRPCGGRWRVDPNWLDTGGPFHWS